MPLLKTEEIVYIRSMSKALRVLAICDSDDEANALMHKRDELAVVADFGGRIYLADKYDRGVQIHEP